MPPHGKRIGGCPTGSRPSPGAASEFKRDTKRVENVVMTLAQATAEARLGGSR
jgi:hypothetical protein